MNMTRLSRFVLLGVCSVVLALFPAANGQSTGKVSQSKTAKALTATKSGAGSAAAGTRKTVAQSAHPVARRGTTRGRPRRAAGPSYQLHPDPARYAEIQRALADRGYFKGEVNGTWGQDSVDALKRFQADQKLPDDGKITALSLTGLGLGPKHDGSTAATAPAPAASAQEPPTRGVLSNSPPAPGTIPPPGPPPPLPRY